tara:strand:- start:760 stop:1419 length:660 start_codon:yes stop_codon:yes gene_type:complete
MASFKQSQIKPGVTKHRSNAVKVYVGTGGCAANDILVATGMQGDFLSVVAADNTDLTKCRGPFFVADYKASDGDYTPVAIPMKTITGVDTSDAAQVGDAVYLSTGGDITLGALPSAPATGSAFVANVRVGRITKVHASEGAYVLEPAQANNAPLVGRMTGSGSAAAVTATGFTAELDGAPVVVSSASGQYIVTATIGSGTLTVTASANTSSVISYAIYA